MRRKYTPAGRLFPLNSRRVLAGWLFSVRQRRFRLAEGIQHLNLDAAEICDAVLNLRGVSEGVGEVFCVSVTWEFTARGRTAMPVFIVTWIVSEVPWQPDLSLTAT